jgi:hypothetical protein
MQGRSSFGLCPLYFGELKRVDANADISWLVARCWPRRNFIRQSALCQERTFHTSIYVTKIGMALDS